MTRRSRKRPSRLALLAIVLGVGACRGNGASDAGAAAENRKPSGNALLDVLARPKLSDEEFIAGIAPLEQARGAADASRDLAAGEPRLLGIPQPGGWFQFPGVAVPRERIPNDVRVARIGGILQNSSNRHAMRYQVLALKYAQEYNGVMIRSIAR